MLEAQDAEAPLDMAAAAEARQQKKHQKHQFSNKYIMLLNEFFYFNEKNNDFAQDRRYDSSRDSSIIDKKDTRKIRLTLRQINQLRFKAKHIN
jgi:hypothetical protein